MNDSKTPTENPAPFIIVDGSSYLFRAYHALPSLETSDGKPTGAIKGVINMLLKICNTYQPKHIAIVFDAKGPTFRHEMYPEYKANRPPMADELASQIAPLHEIVKALGLPLLCEPGVEADDVIGTLAVQASEAGMSTLISTGDKDFAQLVNSHIQLINTMKDPAEIMDEAGVKNKFGVQPSQIIDYLSLVGDSVDNIPGVPKVGPKTATKWLNQYETLEALIQNAEKISGKVGENFRQSIPNLSLSRDLVTIRTALTLPASIEALQRQPEDTEALLNLYTTYEFKTALAALAGSEPKESSEGSNSPKPSNKNYLCIDNLTELKQWISKVPKDGLISFDTETTGLDYMSAELVGISLAVTKDEAIYVPCAHDYPDAPKQISRTELIEVLKPILENQNIPKIGQNLKYDRNVIEKYGIKLAGIAHDTMLESYILNSTDGRHDLDSLAKKFLNHKTVHFEDIAGKGAKQITFNQVPLETATHYAAEDADITLALHHAIYPKLTEIAKLKEVYETIELPLIPILSDMETKGALLNTKLLKEQSKDLQEKITALEAEAYKLAGTEFNLASPKQLGEVLYEQLKLPVLKKTPKGAPSTAEAVLQELALDFPLPEVVLSYRSFAKLKSTYTDKLPEIIHPSTGRVHTSYHQAVTSTGRLSSSDPNLQNIPIRTPEGRKIREAFIAEKGHLLVAADYSQIELRIMAHLSKDTGLCRAFEYGEDIHKATASEVFQCPIDAVTADQRREAKAVNFGLIYGMSAFGLSKQLNIGRHQAQDYIDSYFHHYPGVKEYMDNTRAIASEQGYVETHFGRRLYLPDIQSSNKMRKAAAERTAINAPMQGTAADIIKLAMIQLANWLKKNKLQSAPILQVHDELVLEVPESELDTILQALPNIMTQTTQLCIPLTVDIGHGNNWHQAH